MTASFIPRLVDETDQPRENNKNRFFHIMLNMVDDDLNPYEYRLLGHYIRVGKCEQGVRTIARITKMSVGMVVKTREALKESGYIRVKYRDQKTCLVTVVDRMAENIARYKNGDIEAVDGCSLHEQSVHEMNTSELETVHGVNERRKRTQKEEKDSPAGKTALAQHTAYSPDGDARAGDAAQKEVVLQLAEQSGAGQTDKNSLVEAQQSTLESSPSHAREKSLSLPRSAPQAPRAVPPYPQRPQQAIDAPQARGAATPQSVPHSHKTKAPAGSSSRSGQHPMQTVIVYAFKIPQGAYAGKISQFFVGKMPRQRKDMWSHYQLQTPATPQEILGLLLWYRQHPAYTKSFVEHGGKLPSTPAILRDRLDEFRDLPDREQWMQRAMPILNQLLRGETPCLEPLTEIKPNSMPQRMEAAQAYRPIAPARDPAYTDRRYDKTSSMVTDLFGARS